MALGAIYLSSPTTKSLPQIVISPTSPLTPMRYLDSPSTPTLNSLLRVSSTCPIGTTQARDVPPLSPPPSYTAALATAGQYQDKTSSIAAAVASTEVSQVQTYTDGWRYARLQYERQKWRQQRRPLTLSSSTIGTDVDLERGPNRYADTAILMSGVYGADSDSEEDMMMVMPYRRTTHRVRKWAARIALLGGLVLAIFLFLGLFISGIFAATKR